MERKIEKEKGRKKNKEREIEGGRKRWKER